MKLTVLTSTDIDDSVTSATASIGVFSSREKARAAAEELFEISATKADWESAEGTYDDTVFLIQLWDHELDEVKPEYDRDEE